MPPGDEPPPETTQPERSFGVGERFAADLKSGKAGPIERYLDSDFVELLRTLIVLELKHRRDRGEFPSPEDYLGRFPGRADLIRAVFLEPTEPAPPEGKSGEIENGTAPTLINRRDAPIREDGPSQDGVTVLFRPVGPSIGRPSGKPTDGGERYTLDRRHKSGGIGEIWRAHDHQLGRDVALKRLKPDRLDDPANRARFLREARITGQLQHPGIVPVFELANLPGEDEPFYTMRFIEGPTLSDAAADYNKKRRAGTAGLLDLRQLLGSFLGVCQVIAYANSRGVIHRDLKGQNVVLGDFGEVMVLDWGLAKVVSSRGAILEGLEPIDAPSHLVVEGTGTPWDQTLDGSVMGTPSYMPPEQALGRLDLLDERSDVYGLGAILYEILTGEPPFRGQRADVLHRVIHEPPVPPRRKASDVPRALEAICLKCLAKKSEDRYPSALALADEIQKFLADEPVDAYKDPWIARARRWAARRRTLVTTSIAALLIITVGLSAATALLQVARNDAEKHLTLTLKTVDRFFTRVAGDPRLKTFGLEKLEQQLLDEARDVLEQLVREQSRRPGVGEEHGRIYLRLAQITEKLGDHHRAVEMAVRARSIFEKLADRYPNEAKYDRLKAETLDTLGSAYAAGHFPGEANEALEQASRIWERLASSSRDPEIARLLVANLNRRGRHLCLALRKPSEAEAVLVRARQECDRLGRDHPRDGAHASDEAETTILLGLARGSKDFDAASRLFEEALQKREAIALAQPDNSEEQSKLVENCVMIASFYSNARVPGQIPTLYGKVRLIADRLAKQHRDVPIFAEQAALIEILYTIHVALTGQHAEATGAAERALSSLRSRSGMAKLYAACLFSVASGAAARDPALAEHERNQCVERYQLRAMELLRDARETGILLQPLQFEGVRSTDLDLEPLRRREDFQQFLRDLERDRPSASTGTGATSAASSLPLSLPAPPGQRLGPLDQ